MLYSLFGPPSTLFSSSAEAARLLVTARHGDCKQVEAGTLAEVKAALDENSSTPRPILLTAHAPQFELIEALLANRLPICVSLESPAAAGLQLLRSGAADERGAAQSISRSCSALHELIVRRQAALLSRQQAMYAPDLVAGLAQAIGIELPPQSLADVSAQLGPVAAVEMGKTAADHSLAEGLRAYDELLSVRPVDIVQWQPSLFMAMTPAPGTLSGPIDMTGGARIIAFGPYQHLPIGRWNVSAAFEVRANHSGNKLKVDAYAGGGTAAVLGEAEWPLPVAGRFAASFTIDHPSPDDPLEVRFHQLEGAIEGSFELLGVRLERVAV